MSSLSRLFLSLLLLGAQWRVSCAAPSTAASKIPSLSEATIEELAEGLEDGRFSSVGLVTAYIARINEVNGALKPVLEINPDALSISAALDRERARGRSRGVLHGIPILVKDIIATDDEMNNTAGSFALLGAKAPRDATVVQILRDAGAIILVKTAMSEWANVRSLNSSNGWSARGGQVLSPHIRQGDPFGSSSGSAVAAALGLSAATLGTETDGSLISPAFYNNIVAIKPTVGLTSRHIVITVSQHQDTVGLMARIVRDAAYILQAIAGPDPRDNYTSAIPNAGRIPDYISACKCCLSGSRIGVPRDIMSLFTGDESTALTLAFEKSLALLRSRGAKIVDTSFPLALAYLNSNAPATVAFADFITALPAYLAQLKANPNNITDLADLRNFTQNSPREDFPDRDTALWDAALAQSWGNTDPRFWPAYAEILRFGNEGGLLGALKRDRLDAIVLPSEFAPHWAAGVGAPVVSVPMGAFPGGTPVVETEKGLVREGPNVPFAINFMGALWSEAKLIGLAYGFEHATRVREKVKPYISPKTEIRR